MCWPFPTDDVGNPYTHVLSMTGRRSAGQFKYDRAAALSHRTRTLGRRSIRDGVRPVYV